MPTSLLIREILEGEDLRVSHLLEASKALRWFQGRPNTLAKHTVNLKDGLVLSRGRLTQALDTASSLLQNGQTQIFSIIIGGYNRSNPTDPRVVSCLTEPYT